MTADLFSRAGRALFGSQWRVLLGEQLGINDSTVRRMSTGYSRVPPGVWREIEALLIKESDRMRLLADQCDGAAVQANHPLNVITMKDCTKLTVSHPGKIDPRDPDPGRPPPFDLHNCARCQDGARPCVNGEPRRCDWLRARND